MSYQSEAVKRCQRKKLAFIQAYKVEQGCSLCGFLGEACQLDLHHRDPETKLPKLTKTKGSGRMYTGGSRWVDLSYAEIHAEIAKCDVVCANCHRLLG